MAYYEHLGGNKYKLITRDPSKAKRKRITKRVEVPATVAKNEKKKEQWLALELARWVDGVESGTIVKVEKITFRDFVPKWKKGYADQHMGEYTRRQSMIYIDTYLMPVFGDVRMDQIKTLHLVSFMAELLRKDGKPMSTNTKLNIYKAAKSIFDAATDWEVIAKNPIDGVQRPSTSKKEKKQQRDRKKAYDWQEAAQVLIDMYELPTRWRLYFTGVILGGFRRGELLAVEWPMVDYEAGAIYIEKQITFNESGGKIEGELKTEESEGWVPMPRWYIDQLRGYELEWKKEKLQCKKWEGGEKQYIFHGGKGMMYFPTTATNTWSKFLKRHNLPHIPLHGLRHTAGMLLRESGAELKTIQEQLRHSKIGTTADIYTHKSTMVSRAAIDPLEQLDPKQLKSAPLPATFSR